MGDKFGAVRLAAIFALLVYAGPAWAQDFKGLTLRLDDGTILVYRADGSYSYSDPSGRRAGGRWTQNGEQVCVYFPNGNRRCDRTVWQGTVPVQLVNAQGGAWSITVISSPQR
jgi:hypothetical protein